MQMDMYSSELCWGIFRYDFERKELKLIYNQNKALIGAISIFL